MRYSRLVWVFVLCAFGSVVAGWADSNLWGPLEGRVVGISVINHLSTGTREVLVFQRGNYPRLNNPWQTEVLDLNSICPANFWGICDQSSFLGSCAKHTAVLYDDNPQDPRQITIYSCTNPTAGRCMTFNGFIRPEGNFIDGYFNSFGCTY